MSKGPGRWQRLILEAVDHGEADLRVLLAYRTRSEASAIYRAIGRLRSAGRIATARGFDCYPKPWQGMIRGSPWVFESWGIVRKADGIPPDGRLAELEEDIAAALES